MVYGQIHALHHEVKGLLSCTGEDVQMSSISYPGSNSFYITLHPTQNQDFDEWENPKQSSRDVIDFH